MKQLRPSILCTHRGMLAFCCSSLRLQHLCAWPLQLAWVQASNCRQCSTPAHALSVPSTLSGVPNQQLAQPGMLHYTCQGQLGTRGPAT